MLGVTVQAPGEEVLDLDRRGANEISRYSPCARHVSDGGGETEELSNQDQLDGSARGLCHVPAEVIQKTWCKR